MPRVIHFYRPKTRSVVVARIDELPNTYEGLSPEEVMEIQNGVQDLADEMFDNGFLYICEADVDGKEVWMFNHFYRHKTNTKVVIEVPDFPIAHGRLDSEEFIAYQREITRQIDELKKDGFVWLCQTQTNPK